MQLSRVQLSADEDSIRWRFTADDQYSTNSAYAVQFIGAIRDGQWSRVWQAKVENKCKLFMWLLLQIKLPTADRVLKYNGEANPICTLCRTNAEKHLHMVAKCSYTQAVWQLIASWFNIQAPSPSARTTSGWWKSLLRQGAAFFDKGDFIKLMVFSSS
jgi:hypothetical protein